ncbi:hypothetical protein ACIQ9E_08925 [Streptomyces sp. NPDC094448]|uniref:hypothetical protein n=1 Tax=Streptomyces sp. NPDC094448 TaxID=3366063 RepID=UPI0037F85451
MSESLIDLTRSGTGYAVAGLTVCALLFMAVAALRLSNAGRTEPSDEARSLRLALYGGVLAAVSLGLFVTVI